MNRCVYYVEGKHPADIPPGQQYDGLRYTVCGHEGPYMVNGSSYCQDHVRAALGHTTIKVGHTLHQQSPGMPAADDPGPIEFGKERRRRRRQA